MSVDKSVAQVSELYRDAPLRARLSRSAKRNGEQSYEGVIMHRWDEVFDG